MKVYIDRDGSSNEYKKTGNNRTTRSDLLQGSDVKSRNTAFATISPFFSIGDVSKEPFTHALQNNSIGSALDSVVFEPYVDTYKPISPEGLLNTDDVYFSTIPRRAPSTSIEPLDTVTLRLTVEKTRGFRASTFATCGRFENEKIVQESSVMSNTRKILDDSNFFGTVKYDGYIKEEVNFETFNDNASSDIHDEFSMIKVPRTKKTVIGGTGGCDFAENGQYTLTYGGLCR